MVVVGKFCDHPDVTNARVVHMSSGGDLSPDDILIVGEMININCGTLYLGEVNELTISCESNNE